MSVAKMLEDHKFYNANEIIKVVVTEGGVIYGNHPSITIVSKIVEPGEVEVMAMRNEKLVEVAAGDVVGVVVPLTAEQYTEAVDTAEDPPDDQNVDKTDKSKKNKDKKQVEQPTQTEQRQTPAADTGATQTAAPAEQAPATDTTTTQG